MVKLVGININRGILRIVDKRKYYIDNLRWLCILLLVPFHSGMAWNSWGEGSYVWFHGNRGISTFIMVIAPWYMSLLFVVAGMSAKYSLQKRSYSLFLKERILKLLIPCITGMVTVVHLMTYYADVFHNGYDEGFLSHYRVFFTKFTTLTGYDGAWTVGHLWFLLYLFLISVICIGIISLQRRFLSNLQCNKLGIVAIMACGILPILTNPILDFAGKSIGSYLMLFLIGYYIISEDEVMDKISKYRFMNLIIMLVANIGNVYLFLWKSDSNAILNTILMYITQWFGILTMLGFGKRLFNQNNRITRYLSSRSFLFYIFHFIWLVVLQFYLSKYTDSTWILFVIPVLATYLMTFLTSEVIIRIPCVNRLFGIK